MLYVDVKSEKVARECHPKSLSLAPWKRAKDFWREFLVTVIVLN